MILAIMIGLLMGIGAFIVWKKTSLTYYSAAEKEVARPSSSLSKTDTDLPSTADPVSIADLTPYKALYTVQLAGVNGATDILDIQGKMMYQIAQSCDRTVTDYHYFLTYYYPDSAPLRTTSDFSIAETHKGGQFDFTARRRREGVLYEELRGSALFNPGQEGKAFYTSPEDLQFDLPANTYFLADQTVMLIDAAKKGKKFVSFTLFDGSDKDGPKDVTALITPVPASYTPPKNENIDASLFSPQAWVIRLAFFSRLEPQETSDSEMTIVLHDNGVISSTKIDYTEYTVIETMTALKAPAPIPCDSLPSGQQDKTPVHKAIPPESIPKVHLH